MEHLSMWITIHYNQNTFNGLEFYNYIVSIQDEHFKKILRFVVNAPSNCADDHFNKKKIFITLHSIL